MDFFCLVNGGVSAFCLGRDFVSRNESLMVGFCVCIVGVSSFVDSSLCMVFRVLVGCVSVPRVRMVLFGLRRIFPCN